jgi:hypothetical protein
VASGGEASVLLASLVAGIYLAAVDEALRFFPVRDDCARDKGRYGLHYKKRITVKARVLDIPRVLQRFDLTEASVAR